METLHCEKPPCDHHIKSNLSWFGPVAMTTKPGHFINFTYDISIPKEKCCPGMVVLTSAVREDLNKRKMTCMDMTSKTLEFLYDNEYDFIHLDYHYRYSDACSPPDNNGIYRCARNNTGLKSQTAVYAAAYFYYPCQDTKGLEMVYNVDIQAEEVNYKCFDLKSESPVCSNYYKSAFLPNLLGSDDTSTPLDIILVTLHLQDFYKQCHKHLEEILCRIFLPECTVEGKYLSPCPSLLKEALYACKKYIINNKFLNIPKLDVSEEAIEKYYIKKFETGRACFNKIVTCENPPKIDHGSYIVHSNSTDVHPNSTDIQSNSTDVYKVKTSVTYSCDTNYDLDGESTAYCEYSGVWKPIPKCILKPNGNTMEIITASVLSCLVFVVIVSIVLIIKYRQEIAVLLYAKYGFRINALKEKQCKYDAFIAYNMEDIGFVKNELLNRLEKAADPSYSICIHHRNFEVGDWIANNIINAVGQSRRTIIVLSQNFLNSQWCRFEFSQAHFRLIEDQSFKIIVIALEDPKRLENVPKLINSYIRTGTYISTDNKLFWEKLFYQMPSGHRMIKLEINDMDCNAEREPCI